MRKTLPLLGVALFAAAFALAPFWIPWRALASPESPRLFSPVAALTIDPADLSQEVIPSGWPVARELARISSEFGPRRHPIYKVVTPHRGIDLAIPESTPIRATGDGVVVFAGTALHYGEMVRVWHEGAYQTLYAHNSRVLVQPGDPVRRGAVIALSGNTGISTGPHLHYEVRKQGIPQNPRTYLN